MIEQEGKSTCYLGCHGLSRQKCGEVQLTSSSFSMIMEKALKMEVVGPARVMIRSGQFPSEMLMRAPLCERERERKKRKKQIKETR